MSDPEEARRRLGRIVKAERLKRYRTVDAARIQARISRGAWDHVEKGQPASEITYSAVEEALGWPAGRCQQILDGDGDAPDAEAEVLASNINPATQQYILRVLAEQRDREQRERGSA